MVSSVTDKYGFVSGDVMALERPVDVDILRRFVCANGLFTVCLCCLFIAFCLMLTSPYQERSQVAGHADTLGPVYAD